MFDIVITALPNWGGKFLLIEVVEDHIVAKDELLGRSVIMWSKEKWLRKDDFEVNLIDFDVRVKEIMYISIEVFNGSKLINKNTLAWED